MVYYTDSCHSALFPRLGNTVFAGAGGSSNSASTAFPMASRISPGGRSLFAGVRALIRSRTARRGPQSRLDRSPGSLGGEYVICRGGSGAGGGVGSLLVQRMTIGSFAVSASGAGLSPHTLGAYLLVIHLIWSHRSL